MATIVSTLANSLAPRAGASKKDSAAPESASVADPTKLPIGYEGIWYCDLARSDALSPFVAEMGIPWPINLIANKLRVKWKLTPTEGGFKQTLTTLVISDTTTYVFGKEVATRNPDGTANKVTAFVLPDGRLQAHGFGLQGQDILTTCELLDNGTVLLATIDCMQRGKTERLITKRYFRREA